MSIWGTCRKKPVEVQYREVQKKSCGWDINESPDSSQCWGEYIQTKEGRMFANAEKDYIIKGIQGEEYPIKKDIFNATYTTSEPIDHKAEWYLKKNAELTKALLKIKKILDKLDLKDIDLTVENLLKIQNIIEKQNLESGWTPSKVDDKDGSVMK
jgi:hypothetical protein